MTLLQEIAADPRLAYRLTVGDYHQMLRDGVLMDGDPYELLDGQIVRKMRNAQGEGPLTIGTRHTTAVMLLGDLNPKLNRHGYHIRLQAPMTLPPYDEPEPDGAIVVGTTRRYLKSHPTAGDCLCVVEVSDASIRRDRGYKQKLYASNGITMYIIVNLLNNSIEVRTKPVGDKYTDTVILKSRQKLTLPVEKGKPIKVAVKDLLP